MASSHIMHDVLRKQASKQSINQASKKTDFTVDLIWLAPNTYIQNMSFVLTASSRGKVQAGRSLTCVPSHTHYVVTAFPLQVHVQKVTHINGSHHLVR